MDEGFYCTAPTVWPRDDFTGSMDDVAGDICWERFETATERDVHVEQDHPQWWNDTVRPASVKPRHERTERAAPKEPLVPPAIPGHAAPKANTRSMACYACGRMNDCTPTELSDKSWAWMCDRCEDPTLHSA